MDTIAQSLHDAVSENMQAIAHNSYFLTMFTAYGGPFVGRGTTCGNHTAPVIPSPPLLIGRRTAPLVV